MMKERRAAGFRWQDEAAGGGIMDEAHPVRRSGVGSHDIRFDGLSDLMLRAKGAAVLDVGCNRGHVAYDFAMNGARIVHGCDLHGPSIQAAKIWFSELPYCESKFEVVDLTEGPEGMNRAFGDHGYDIVLFLGTYHKLKREMTPGKLADLVRHLGERAITYFAWSGYAEDLEAVEGALIGNLRRIHTTEIQMIGRPAAIWKRI
jgi:SAM-dependent methyltransferase